VAVAAYSAASRPDHRHSTPSGRGGGLCPHWDARLWSIRRRDRDHFRSHPLS